MQTLARSNFQLLKADVRHPSLHFKKTGQYWSVRVGRAHRALGRAVEIALLGNGLVEATAPWKLAKESSEDAASRLDAVLYTLAEALRIIAILISPVLPKGAHGIFDQLNWKTELSGKGERFRLEDAKWGGLPDGHTVGKPVPLFPRIEQQVSGSTGC